MEGSTQQVGQRLMEGTTQQGTSEGVHIYIYIQVGQRLMEGTTQQVGQRGCCADVKLCYAMLCYAAACLLACC